MRSAPWDSRGPLRWQSNNKENMAKQPMLANHTKRYPYVLPTVRLMPGDGPTHATGLYASSICIAIETIQKMGPSLHGPIHPSRGMHNKKIYHSCNVLLHEVGRIKTLMGQHGRIYRKIPLRKHLVLVPMSHRTHQ